MAFISFVWPITQNNAKQKKKKFQWCTQIAKASLKQTCQNKLQNYRQNTAVTNIKAELVL